MLAQALGDSDRGGRLSLPFRVSAELSISTSPIASRISQDKRRQGPKPLLPAVIVGTTEVVPLKFGTFVVEPEH
jgi:hypothetical protein